MRDMARKLRKGKGMSKGKAGLAEERKRRKAEAKERKHEPREQERKKYSRSTYLGGEKDHPETVTPRMFESFLNEKWLFGVLAMLVILSVIMTLVIEWL